MAYGGTSWPSFKTCTVPNTQSTRSLAKRCATVSSTSSLA